MNGYPELHGTVCDMIKIKQRYKDVMKDALQPC